MSRGIGIIQKKILILLFKHLSLGLCYTPGQRSRTLRGIDREWKKIEEESLRRAIEGLYKNRLIDMKELVDGRIKITLKDSGNKKVLEYKLEDMNIKKPIKWDGKWRMVLFDIPDSKKKIREVLRFHLKRLGFFQYQKSVFIYPYDCKNEIDFLIEFYQIRPHLRQLVISDIDNDFHLRKIFNKLLSS
ncbi:MAG: hypothetical protein Q7S73_00250 [bacterium]|nr:hypothetical protein [bacterium]